MVRVWRMIHVRLEQISELKAWPTLLLNISRTDLTREGVPQMLR